MKTVRNLGEFGLIRALRAIVAPPQRSGSSRGSVVVGIGDDCAVLRGTRHPKYLLFTCDPVVENVHYRRSTPPRRVGWKAMARNLSDIAAMGGIPRWAVVSLGLRSATRVDYVQQLYRGIRAVASRFGCQVVGGDVTRVAHEQFVAVSLVGEVEPSHLVLRSGARAGDAVFVTGRLGGAQRGRHLTFLPRIPEARWLAKHFRPHAMIDLSDGLSSDLRRLVEASRGRVGFEIQAARVPIAPAARGSLASALNDGEDFELLFTADPQTVAALRRRWNRRFDLPLTLIGRVTHSRGRTVLVEADGTRKKLEPAGYEHFRNI